MPTPREELAAAIDMFEGGYQDNQQDHANFVNGRMIGTMRGVTPAVLAAHRGVDANTLTSADMRTVTAEEAADIGLTKFYQGTGLDKLEWGPATAALVDVGWGSGPRQAVLFAQRLAKVDADGAVGPKTVVAYKSAVEGLGWSAAARNVLGQRLAYYNLIIGQHPEWEIYRAGWNRRANWFSPDNPAWWGLWSEKPAVPDDASGNQTSPKIEGRRVQAGLNAWLRSLALVEDGAIGPKSKAVIRLYQFANALRVTGEADPGTRQKLGV